MRTGAKIAFGTSLSAVLYSIQVEYFARERIGAATGARFSPNSGDEIVKNGLATGDLVFFSRRWYRYHIFEALCIKITQILYDSPFDHVGVIVCDQWGEPQVFENRFFKGEVLRPFESRVLHSKAHSVVVVPLLPRNLLSRDEKERLFVHAKACSSEQRPSHRYNGLSPIFASLVGVSSISHSHIVRDCYSKLGIALSSTNHKAIIDRSCTLSRSKTDEDENEDSKTTAQPSLGSVVVVRTT